MSLLGKPLHYNRGSHRDIRYRRLQSRVYNFLERPRGMPAVLYHIMVFFMVFTCLALSVFSTIEEYEKDAIYILFRMEILVVIWFSLEFGMRLWSTGCRSRYQGCMGRLKFLKRPFCIIDVVTIIASTVVLGMGTSGQVFATSALRGLRFFQILRMVRMDRRGGTWKLLGSVVYAHRQELITTMYIGFLGLIFASFLVYLMEKDVNRKFSNFAQALWWGVITLCTVGYGDMVPETWQGKLIASFCALLGISFFALPAGILGSGFALKVQQQQRQKHMIRRRQPAASLIQSVWRCYAADGHFSSTATWKIHQVALPSPPASSEYWDRLFKNLSEYRRTSSSFKNNSSFVARLPTIRRKMHVSQSPLHTDTPMKTHGLNRPAKYTRAIHDENVSVDNLDVIQSGKPLNLGFCEDVADTSFFKKNSDDEDDEPRCTQLMEKHKTAIRFIRKLKYFVARRKFKEALKPYDVKDVMEQYAAGHVDLLGRVKNVHARLDQILGKQGSKAKDAYASKISLASRVVKVERQVADIEEKLDILIKAYMDDRERFLALPMPPHSSSKKKPTWGSGQSTASGPQLYNTPEFPLVCPKVSVTQYQEVQKAEKPIVVNSADSYIQVTVDPPLIKSPKVKKKVTLSSSIQQINCQLTQDVCDTLAVPLETLATPPPPPPPSPPPSPPPPTPSSPTPLAQPLLEERPPDSVPDSIILIDEIEDAEEEDLNCEGEMEQYISWEIESDMRPESRGDDTTEGTALLERHGRRHVITPVNTVHPLHVGALSEAAGVNATAATAAAAAVGANSTTPLVAGSGPPSTTTTTTTTTTSTARYPHTISTTTNLRFSRSRGKPV